MKFFYTGNLRLPVWLALATWVGGSAWAQTAAVAPVGGAVIAAPVAAPAVAAPAAPVSLAPTGGATNLNALAAPAGQGASIGKRGDTDTLQSSLGSALEELSVTGFQRFVQENTGLLLPLFGYDLFAGARFNSLRDVPVPADYVIGPGDEIRLQTWGSVDSNLPLTVDRNGQISIPKVGVINVAGLRESQLEGVLRSNIARYFNNFQLKATLGQLRSMQVFVVGQARRPGTFTVSGLSTLLSVLFESGGPSSTGTMRNIQLKRGGKLMASMDLYKFINEGDKSGDVRLLPGDVIVVPPAGPRVAVMGALDKPAIYEMQPSGEQVGSVLSYGGRTSVLATPHKALLERIDSSQARAPRKVDQLSLNTDGLKRTLNDGDVLTLLKLSPEFSNVVTLRGNVAAPLRYPYRAGMHISDLIPEREALIQADFYKKRNMLVQYESGVGITDSRVLSDVKNLLSQINWEYASVERTDKNTIQTQLLAFNLGNAINNPTSTDDLELQPGDVVTIFNTHDVPISISKKVQYAKVSGEVNAPGVYQLLPGDTIDSLVSRAGGLTPLAYPYGSVFSRESNRVQQQKNLDVAIQRMESDLNSQALTYAQNTRSDDKGQLRESYIQGQRATIARLAKLKSSGRIALEVDYKRQTFPSITLEDMDSIHIPAKSNFVSIFGAVMGEASFIHREGATVRDYIQRAGLTREADEDYIVILRADGSAEVDMRQRASWFGNSHILSKTLHPGDAVLVPERIDRRTTYNRFIDGAKDWTSIFYQFGLGAASIRLLRN